MILIAMLFLLAPIIMFLILARREHHDPSEDYLRAVRETVVPEPSQASHSLVSVDVHQPVTVVTWARKDQIQKFKEQPQAYKYIWVTVVPKLKSFCQEYARSQGPDAEHLTSRLEQRLGLPPGSNDTLFVELTVPDPSDSSKFFRPCGVPAPTGQTCQPGSPPDSTEIDRDIDAVNNKDAGGKPLDPNDEKKKYVESWYWFLDKYYESFAIEYDPSARTSPYPWSSLGYTFDWAPKEDGSDEFVRWGESEFVIAPGTPIKFLSATDTIAYCSP
jgi:hypothetical protein